MLDCEPKQDPRYGYYDNHFSLTRVEPVVMMEPPLERGPWLGCYDVSVAKGDTQAFVDPFMPSKLWFELLMHQRRVGRTGLTPIFLVGAEQMASGFLAAETPFGQFVSMLESLAYEAPPGYDVVVAKCVVHGQPIASLYTSGSPRPPSELVTDYNGNATSLYAESAYFASQSRTINSVADGLWKIFEAPMLRGELSIKAGEYGEFDTSDRALVTECRKRL